MQASEPRRVEAKPHQPKRVDLFTLLLGSLATMLQPRRGRITKRKHGLSGRLPIHGPTFRYRVTGISSAVDQHDPSWKGHHRARRLARVA